MHSSTGRVRIIRMVSAPLAKPALEAGWPLKDTIGCGPSGEARITFFAASRRLRARASRTTRASYSLPPPSRPRAIQPATPTTTAPAVRTPSSRGRSTRSIVGVTAYHGGERPNQRRDPAGRPDPQGRWYARHGGQWHGIRLPMRAPYDQHQEEGEAHPDRKHSPALPRTLPIRPSGTRTQSPTSNFAPIRRALKWVAQPPGVAGGWAVTWERSTSRIAANAISQAPSRQSPLSRASS